MLTASAALALACAPRVALDVLLSVAYAESPWHTLVIHDNVTGEAFAPTSKEAEQISSWLISGGHDPDLGLLQINAANVSRSGLTVATAFDPCASMHAVLRFWWRITLAARRLPSSKPQFSVLSRHTTPARRLPGFGPVCRLPLHRRGR